MAIEIARLKGAGKQLHLLARADMDFHLAECGGTVAVVVTNSLKSHEKFRQARSG